MSKKLIVIVGPTASGKSDLAVKIAKKIKGEIISADSRQVYRGMDIGTGKVTPDTKNSSNFSTGQVKKKYIFTHKGIPHYCIDVASPKTRFNIVQYRKLALRAINKVFKKSKIPILCGGTGFYIQAVVDGIIIPEVPPDWKLRKKLEKKSVKELYQILKELDPRRAKTIEKENPRRLIRAIEIVMKTKKPVPSLKRAPLPYPASKKTSSSSPPSLPSEPRFLIIGIKKEKKELSSLIKKRLLKRLQPTHHPKLITEVKKLRKSGLSWKRLEEFGLEYRHVAQYLQGKLKYNEMTERIQKESEHFAKRQMTWFKKDKRIIWIKDYKEAGKSVEKFLKNK